MSDLKKRIFVWGTSIAAEKIRDNGIEGCIIIGFIDSFHALYEWGGGYRVYLPNEINMYDYDAIIVTSGSSLQIREIAKKMV